MRHIPVDYVCVLNPRLDSQHTRLDLGDHPALDDTCFYVFVRLSYCHPSNHRGCILWVPLHSINISKRDELPRHKCGSDIPRYSIGIKVKAVAFCVDGNG